MGIHNIPIYLESDNVYISCEYQPDKYKGKERKMYSNIVQKCIFESEIEQYKPVHYIRLYKRCIHTNLYTYYILMLTHDFNERYLLGFKRVLISYTFIYVRRVYFASKEEEAYFNTTILQVKQCTKWWLYICQLV